MFEKWGFLLSEIWVLLALAALVGLFAGWLIWGRRRVETRTETVTLTDTAAADRLRAELDACGKERTRLGERVAALEADLTASRAAATPGVATKPASLAAARDGKPDDLKLIKGVGPVLEQLCHKLGYFHFDQIAAWTASEIAWVDDNLEGFKGRVTRDEWVVQARDLAAGKPARPGSEN